VRVASKSRVKRSFDYWAGLDDIEGDMDAGSQFWNRCHAVQGRLAADLKEYCPDQE